MVIRRALLPLFLLIVAGLGLVFLAVAIVGVPVAVVDRRWRLTRVSLFASSYCAVELAAVTAAGAVWVRHLAFTATGSARSLDWQLVNRRILRCALDFVLRSAWRCLCFRVELDGRSTVGSLGDHEPLLVLARHGGPGDSLALVHLLMSRFHRRVRVVVKGTLLLDPAIDILLNRTGCCFLRRRESAVHDLRDLVSGLDQDDIVLLFPEGGNWSPARRIRAIRHLRRQQRREAARAAELMEHVLPPRPAGVLAWIEQGDNWPIMIAAHAGLDKIVTLWDGWEAVPFGNPLTVRLLTATAPPDGDEARLAWLRAEWAVVDEWIDLHHARIKADGT